MVASESLSVSKSLLAKLMATENLIVEEKNVQTASFDVKKRILTIPILNKELSPQLYDLFTGHEVGHALWTPEEGIKKGIDLKIPAQVLNLVEDSRIERKIKNKYPGLRKSFIQGYNELMERNFFGIKDTEYNQLNLMDRINMHCKGGAGLNISFNEEESSIVRKIENTETYDDVIRVSLELYEYCKQQNEKKKAQKDSDPDQDDDFDFEYDFDDNDDPEGEELEASDVEDPNQEDGDHDDGDEGESKESNGKIERPVSGPEGDDFRSFTDEAYRQNEKKLFSNSNTNYVYCNIPKIDTKEAIIGYKELYKKYKQECIDTRFDGVKSYHDPKFDEYQKLKHDTNKIVSYLAKEFEMRKNADQLKRASVAKTGELNMSKIYSYGFSEDIFKKISVVPGGKSHGLVMFIDWSGSMSNHMSNTVKQLLSLVMFCKKVNIPYDVYAFSDNDYNSIYRVEQKAGDLRLHGFKLFNLLSSKMSAAEFTYAAAVISTISNEERRAPDWLRLSGTPLNEAVIASMEIVPQFQKDHKLQIVNTVFLTDGDGHQLREVVAEDNVDGQYIFGFDVMVLRDEKTKQQEIVDTQGFGGAEQTKALVKLLKARTGSNVIGFYILFPREFGTAQKFFPKGADMYSLKDTFKKEKFVVVKNSGFSEYYLIKSEMKDEDEDTGFTVKENATTRGLVSAFTKYTNGRVMNRVLLNRFIGLIA